MQNKSLLCLSAFYYFFFSPPFSWHVCNFGIQRQIGRAPKSTCPFSWFLPSTHKCPTLFPPASPAGGDPKDGSHPSPSTLNPPAHLSKQQKRVEPNVWHGGFPPLLLAKCLFSVFKDTLTRHVELTSFINIHLPQFGSATGKNMYRSGLHILAQLIAFFSLFLPLRLLQQLCFFLPLSPADSEETHPHTQNNSFRDMHHPSKCEKRSRKHFLGKYRNDTHYFKKCEHLKCDTLR